MHPGSGTHHVRLGVVDPPHFLYRKIGQSKLGWASPPSEETSKGRVGHKQLRTSQRGLLLNSDGMSSGQQVGCR
jgi:hypothetical protein